MDVPSSIWITIVVSLSVVVVALAVDAALSRMKSASMSRQEQANKAARRMAHAPAEEFLDER